MSKRAVLTRKCSITPEKALHDVNPRKPPLGIPSALYDRGRHSQSIGWYRGHQAGVYDAYLTIKDKYPRVAKQLLEAFGMDDDGVISMEIGNLAIISEELSGEHIL